MCKSSISINYWLYYQGDARQPSPLLHGDWQGSEERVYRQPIVDAIPRIVISRQHKHRRFIVLVKISTRRRYGLCVQIVKQTAPHVTQRAAQRATQYPTAPSGRQQYHHQTLALAPVRGYCQFRYSVKLGMGQSMLPKDAVSP